MVTKDLLALDILYHMAKVTCASSRCRPLTERTKSLFALFCPLFNNDESKSLGDERSY